MWIVVVTAITQNAVKRGGGMEGALCVAAVMVTHHHSVETARGRKGKGAVVCGPMHQLWYGL